ncbi:MAG TPA: class I SAM-dependent methyltransferase [Natronosporangium sp.]
MNPIRNLTSRQLLALGAAGVLVVAILVAAAVGLETLTTALVGLLVGLVLATTVQLRRRLSEVEARSRAALAAIQEVQAEQAALTNRLEFAQRQLVAAVAQERLAAGDRHQQLLSAVGETRQRLVRSGRDRTTEVEALLQLYRDFQPRAPMPASGHWAIDATGLLELVSLLRDRHPKLVVELGSGTSSVWLGYAIERTGGRLVSIDHDPGYAERTGWLLERHGLTGVAEVRVAPLRPLTIGDETFQWYDAAAFEDLADIELLVVDGPPGATNRQARYPALHVLERRLAASAAVVLDDADRADEQAIIERWLAAVDGLARDRTALGMLAVFSYARPAAG